MNYKKSLMMLTCTMLLEFTAGHMMTAINWGARLRANGMTYIQPAFAFWDADLYKVIFATAGLMLLIILLHWKEVKRDMKEQFEPISQKYEAWEDAARAKRRERKKK